MKQVNDSLGEKAGQRQRQRIGCQKRRGGGDGAGEVSGEGFRVGRAVGRQCDGSLGMHFPAEEGLRLQRGDGRDAAPANRLPEQVLQCYRVDFPNLADTGRHILTCPCIGPAAALSPRWRGTDVSFHSDGGRDVLSDTPAAAGGRRSAAAVSSRPRQGCSAGQSGSLIVIVSDEK